MNKKPLSDFNFDLDAMKKAVNSPKLSFPKSALENDDSFEKWLNDTPPLNILAIQPNKLN